MSHDALFQLGMGPVELDATQTEEPFAARAPIGAATAFAVPAARRHRRKLRGNSTKALIARAGAAAPRPHF